MKNRCYGCMQMKNQSPVCEHCGFDEQQHNRPHQLPLGTVLHGQYVVGKVLGQGGFGITYIGWDTMLVTPVAIKEYYPNSAVIRNCTSSLRVASLNEVSEEYFHHSRERFIKEAKILAKLRSVPGIVHVQRLFEENNTAYIVMEYIQGINLKNYLQRLGRPLSAEEAFAVMEPVIYTLSKVHEAGLVHRDISPDNIMIQNDGTAKLLDFGSAREVENMALDKELPQSTEVILKHGFAPLEQYRRRGNLGSWTDIYALCATIHYCLTGAVPSGALERLGGESDVDWHRIPGLMDYQISALERGFELRPENRIQTARELWDGLFDPRSAAGKEENGSETASEAVTPNRKTGGRKKSGASIAALLAVVCAGFLAVGLLPAKDAQNDAPAAEVVSTQMHHMEETAAASISTETAPTEWISPAWEENVLIKKPDHTVADSAAGSWDVSENQDRSVLAWAEERDGLYDVYIAAEGGINAVNACGGLFESYDQLTTVNFNGCFHTEYAQDMHNMFRRCGSMTQLDLSGIHTSSATNMTSMFAGCENLKTLNLAGFDTAGVTDMSYMFSSCKSLESLELLHFDTSCVTNMCSMFAFCESLPELDLSSFHTPCVTDLRSMFTDCYQLASIDMSHFDTHLVTDMSYMFYKCQSLAGLDLGSFQTSYVSSMVQMFAYCENLVTLDISNFDFRGVSDLYGTFYHCARLEFLDLGVFDISRYTNTENMYFGCYRLPSKYKHFA